MATLAHVRIPGDRGPRQVSLSLCVDRNRYGERSGAIHGGAFQHLSCGLAVLIVNGNQQIVRAVVLERDGQAVIGENGAAWRAAQPTAESNRRPTQSSHMTPVPHRHYHK